MPWRACQAVTVALVAPMDPAERPDTRGDALTSAGPTRTEPGWREQREQHLAALLVPSRHRFCFCAVAARSAESSPRVEKQQRHRQRCIAAKKRERSDRPFGSEPQCSRARLYRRPMQVTFLRGDRNECEIGFRRDGGAAG